ncbi:MAG TPA: zf-HC2 domain-containing protein [Gemmatimonadaceae bacterium]|nr:zf-HC2 domain-containing protein [Gemmatimonadaceae bacterium]
MTYDKHDCDLMCERLASYLEGELAPDEKAEADRHLAECASCTEVLAELRTISAEAATMPLLAPTRDLWAGIESRISTPVTLLGGAPAAVRRVPQRQWQFALAAAALIAATAGTTYLIASSRGGTAAPAINVAARTPQQAAESITTPTPGAATAPRATPAPMSPSNVSQVFHPKRDVSAARVYDLEISLLDSVVHTRRESLDPKTVAIIEKNLKIIDKAITESRAALAKDPKSPLLSNQLDNVLGSKVELLRTVAFLPTQS